MGITFQEGKFTVTAEGQKSEVQLKMADCVGLARQQDGTYAMVGDVYYAREQPKLTAYYNRGEKFAADFTTAYSIEQSKGRLEEQGFTCTDNEQGTVDSQGMVVQIYQRN